MINRLIRFTFLVVLTVGVWIVNQEIPTLQSENLFHTLAGLTIIYGVFRLFLQEIAERNLKDEKIRYTVRKAISIIYIALFVITAIRIWVSDPQTLVVAYGLVGAGVAVALRDVFANFAGGINLFLTRPYKVGHRVQIGEHYGDVIDTGVFYTTLLEIRGWVDGDQATGRTIVVPNGVNLSESVVNYTQDNSFIWDEIQVPLKYGTDIEKAKNIMVEASKSETERIMEKADSEMKKIRRKYYLSRKDTQPEVYVELTDNWVSLSLRYISDVRRRRQVYSDISTDILNRFQEEGIEVASQTLDIS